MGTKKGKADIDMEYMKFDDAYVVRLDRGEEIVESLTKICDRFLLQTGKILTCSMQESLGLPIIPLRF
jgi:predicted DNA-binding protein with PD1-like motif